MKIARGTPVWLSILPVVSILLLVPYLLISRNLLFIAVSASILVLTFFVMLFFRDPERSIAEGVVSPADGKVTRADRKGQYCYISIFMNIHNVHVNRMPWSGKVTRVQHIPGGYVPAFDKDSDENERVVIDIKTQYGKWKITQIAGAVARRIVPYVKEGEILEKGGRFGLIRFGSRVDLEMRLPRGFEMTVSPGDKVLAGSTSLALYKRFARRDRAER